jgi:hypothetical protein
MSRKRYHSQSYAKQQSLNLEFQSSFEIPGRTNQNTTKKLDRKHVVFASAVLLCLCAAGLGYVSYTAIKYSIYPSDVGQIPLLEASLAPIRSLPDNPGGMIVDNQDKLIYDNLTTKKRETVRQVTQNDDNQLLRTPKHSKPPTRAKEINKPGLGRAAAKSNSKKRSQTPFDLMPSKE